MPLFKSTHIALIFYLNILIICIQDNNALSDFPFQGKENSFLQKQIFDDETGNKVPEYEIVQLRILSKRSTDDENVIRVHLTAFGRDIHLHLKKDDFNDRARNVKFFEALLTDTIQLSEVICEDDPGTPYIDLDQMAAITIRHGPDGELQMDGVIGDDLFIKPASTDSNFKTDNFVYDRYFSVESGDKFNTSGSDARKVSGQSSSAATKSGVHIVYRTAMKTKSAFKVVLDDVLNNIYSNHNVTRHKRPLHVWPEVLLIVDYDSYIMHQSNGFNDKQIRRYYISFFNGVDLRFKTLSDPKISLILTRILVFKNRDGTPYLKRNRYPNLDVFDGSRAIDELAHVMYLVKTKLSDIHLEFDLAVLLTKLDMCTAELSHCSRAAIGLAFLDGACVISHENKLWYGVAIVEDSGGFDGILTAAHEIGHLLGSAHDGENHSKEVFQNASFCSGKDGYIMSNKLSSNQIFRWSECSIRLFRQFLSSDNASCLFNQPSYPNKLEGSELPGAVLSLDEQCKRIWGTQASAWDSRVCTTLHCLEPTDRTIQNSRLQLFLPPAAEGSSCGEDLHCRHGKCVSKYLTYSQAWNMAPVGNIHFPIITTSKKPPFVEEDDIDCSEDTDEFFCDSYFSTIGHKEACRNSRIAEECCHSHKILCKYLPL